MEQHRAKFDPKLRAYSILQHKVEDVVHKSIKIWKIVFGLLFDKDEDKGSSTSKDVEPAIELNVMGSPILEIEAPKAEEIQKVLEVHIVDITEDTPIKNQILTKEDIQAKKEKDTSLLGNNTILLQVKAYLTIDETSTVNITPAKSAVVTVDMLAGTRTTEEQDKLALANQTTSAEELQQDKEEKFEEKSTSPHVEDKGTEGKEVKDKAIVGTTAYKTRGNTSSCTYVEWEHTEEGTEAQNGSLFPRGNH